MQTIQDLQENIFFECKNIIHSVSQISNVEELLREKNLVSELLEKISVLNFLESHAEVFNQFTGLTKEKLTLPEEELNDDFQNEIVENEIPKEYFSDEIINPQIETLDIAEEEEPSPEITFDIANDEEETYDEENFTKNNDDEEENITTHIHFEVPEEVNEDETIEYTTEKYEISEEPSLEIHTEIPNAQEEFSQVEIPNIEEEQEQAENKIKLAKIKYQNSQINTLFDEETMNEITEKTTLKETGENTKREFSLDLNDKIAFSKMLFDGSQVELANVVQRLNAFTNLDDAKQYLSDMYYDKKWDRVDEYAQRLWILVENKFL